MHKVKMALATGFGFGLYAPFAPGTFGSLPGVALVFAVSLLPVFLQIPAALLLAAASVPVCTEAEERLGIKDDGRIVADEWMLLPISFIGLPVRGMPIAALLAMFAVVRAVDIVKPWPCNRLQSLRGGLGIVADDFFANVYSLGLNWILWITLFR